MTMTQEEQASVRLEHVSKYYETAAQRVTALENLSWSVNPGEAVALMGPSGCGKSTLLYVLSTMDTDYEGEVIIDQEVMPKKDQSFLAKIRNEKIYKTN